MTRRPTIALRALALTLLFAVSASATAIFVATSPTGANAAARYSTVPLTVTPTPCGTGWNALTSPNAPSSTNNVLNGAARLSPTGAWAVGSYTSTLGTSQTLIERYDGANWSLVSSPNPADQINVLQGVSAVSNTDAWAVGYSKNAAGAYTTLIVRWNGASWSAVSSPNPGAGDNYLFGVSMTSATDGWAVGYAVNGLLYRTIILRWNGSTWSSVDPPNPGLGGGLRAVHAISATDAWAVGAYADFSLNFRTLALRWNGSSWSQVNSPSVGTTSALTAVDSVSSSDVWAVGVSSTGGPYSTLTMHFTGSSWAIAASPNQGTLDNALGGVYAIAASDVWAVGGYDTGTAAGTATLALHWNGVAWTPGISANPGTTGNRLVAADYFAVGAQASGGPDQTLIEELGPVVCPSPTATPSATSTATGVVSPTATATPCTISFSDVSPSDYFYEAVRYLYCHGAISGYADGTFRPYNNATRGQLSKIIVLAEAWTINTTGGPHFSDVLPGSPFYDYVETAYNRGVISGYSDGTFRPGNNVTRGQLSKIIVLAEQWPINTTGGPHFSDVPPGSAFYDYVETAYNRGVISGYADGTFRPGNNAIRGQISKIVYNAVTGP